MKDWKVATIATVGEMFYRVYRIIDDNAVGHSGNREYIGDYFEDRQEAEELRDKLNGGE